MTALLPDGFEVAAATDTGYVRAVNQDRAAGVIDGGRRFAGLIVCDGLGGLADGDRAAEIAVREAQRALDGGGSDAAAALERAALSANRLIFEAGGGAMGTTFVAVAVEGAAFEVLHAGDSRAYLLRGNTLAPLTLDHSWVAEQVLAGRMTPEEAMRDPRRSMITRCLGTDAHVALERSAPRPWLPGDVLLACSDGLHGFVRFEQIRTLLSAKVPVTSIAGSLVDAANGEGGFDNVAVAVARFPVA